MKKKAAKSPAEKAFANSGKHKLGDLKLNPWTPQREIRAQEIGMLYPNLGKEGWTQFRKTNLYPGAIRDVIIFVYLTTLEPTTVSDATYEDAEKWAVKKKLHNTRGDVFWDAFAKFIEVQNEISASATRPAETGDDEDNPGNE